MEGSSLQLNPSTGHMGFLRHWMVSMHDDLRRTGHWLKSSWRWLHEISISLIEIFMEVTTRDQYFKQTYLSPVWRLYLPVSYAVYARHVSDFGFKGFLGVVLLASCSVYFGYTEYVPTIGLHFPSECVPSIGLHLPCIQSNDLLYTVFVCQVFSPMNGASSRSRKDCFHKRRHQGSR